MTERILGPTGSPRRRRWLGSHSAGGAGGDALRRGRAGDTAGAESAGYFELDKDLINNEQPQSSDVGTALAPNFVALGTLGGNINASATSFTVCQAVALNPATPITIQIDAERMTVGAIANASGGGVFGCVQADVLVGHPRIARGEPRPRTAPRACPAS